jgi:tetratricopeptide (TPR) repeat protein
VTAGRWRGPLLAGLLLAAAAAAYLPVLGNGFVNLDDPGYLTQNEYVKSGLTLRGAAWAFTSVEQANWHPLTWLSHMADVSLFGMDPRGHHLTSLLLHLANGLLLVLLLRQATGRLLPALLVGGLFLLHPLHVESVAWAAERKDVLCTLFWFLALVLWLRWLRERRPVWGWLAAAAHLLSLLAKPMPVSLPLLLLLLDWWPLGRLGRGELRRLVVEKTPFFLLSALSAAGALLSQGTTGAMSPLDRLPFLPRLSNALISLVLYLGQALHPVSLAVFYPHPGWDPRPIGGLGALALLLPAGGLALRWRRSRPWLAVGFGWYLVSILPVIGLVQVGSQAMADRYTYVPLAGIFLAVSWALLRPEAARWRTAVLASAAAVLALLGGLTHRQAGLWRDSETLFRHAVAVTEGNWLARVNLGNALVDQGRLREGKEQYHLSLREKPDHDVASFNLGNAFLREGDSRRAEELYRRAVTINPDYYGAHLALGILLIGQGRYGEALEHYREAWRIRETDPELANNVGVALSLAGRLEEAPAWFARALAMRPAYADAHFNWGAVLEETGDRESALVHYREALRIDPGHARAAAMLSGRF